MMLLQYLFPDQVESNQGEKKEVLIRNGIKRPYSMFYSTYLLKKFCKITDTSGSCSQGVDKGGENLSLWFCIVQKSLLKLITLCFGLERSNEQGTSNHQLAGLSTTYNVLVANKKRCFFSSPSLPVSC